MSKRPVADQRTRLVSAVKRRVDEEATRPVKAVRRRSAGLLPPRLMETRRVSFMELRSFNFSGNDYEVCDDAGGVVMRAESRLHVFRGWRYDFTLGGETRFSMSRRTQSLLLDGLKVSDAKGAVLGEFQQQPTAFAVHFDVIDGQGTPRFAVRQPAETWTRFSIERGKTTLAEVARSHRVWDGSLAETIRVQDAFEISFRGTTDELDRALIITAGLFLDRLYFSQEDNSSLVK